MSRTRPTLPLNPMRTFSVACRHPTFTSAAVELGVTQVAVSRQISILEGYLGVQLFERDKRAARLTDIGRYFGQEIAGHFDQLEDATQRLLQMESKRTVHLRVYPSVAHFWLLPRLSTFHDQYPELRVRLDTKVQPLDFRGTHLDAAIQLGSGIWQDAKARKLFDERIDVVGAPTYIEALDLTEFNGLDNAQLLHARYRRRAWEQWADMQGISLVQEAGMEFDSSLLAYSAATQGFGLAMGQLDLLAGEIGKGHLITPFFNPVKTGMAFQIIWPRSRSVGTHTRLFIDWLLIQVEQSPEFFHTNRNKR